MVYRNPSFSRAEVTIRLGVVPQRHGRSQPNLLSSVRRSNVAGPAADAALLLTTIAVRDGGTTGGGTTRVGNDGGGTTGGVTTGGHER